MHLSVTARNDTAALVAKQVHENTTGCSAIATEVGRAGHPDAAVVAIIEDGKTTCTAKVAVHHNRLVYASASGTHVSYPIRRSDAGRVVRGFLSMEHN